MQTQSAQPQTTRPPLRTVREAQGLSLRQAAQLAGVDIGHLSRVERGEASLSLDALARLAEVLSLRSLAELLHPYRRERGGS
jgi:transcriptional regulator with XRE-family HTH domain